MISPSIISNYIYGEPPTIDQFKGIYYFDRFDSRFRGCQRGHRWNCYISEKNSYPRTQFTDLIYNFPCYILPSGIDNHQSPITMDLFPKSCPTFMTIKFPQAKNGLKSIEIFDMRGVKMFQGQTKDTTWYKCEGLSRRLYTIRIGTGTTNYTSRFCKTGWESVLILNRHLIFGLLLYFIRFTRNLWYR